MPEQFLHQVKYLCQQIPKVEWSGVLFYEVSKGTIARPSSMEITLKQILPLDKGSAGYTEYELDDRYVEYIMNNPEAQEWKIGHIHSHNTMGVFFSGTDTSELRDNCGSHNFYLSLIVNNFMDFCAKIAIQAVNSEDAKIQYTALDENGEEYVIASETAKSGNKMITYDCDVQSPHKEIIVTDEFKAMTTKIIEDASKVVSKSPVVVHHKTSTVSSKRDEKRLRESIDRWSRIGGSKKEEEKEENFGIGHLDFSGDVVVRGFHGQGIDYDNENDYPYNSFIDDFPESTDVNRELAYEIQLHEFLISLLRGTNPKDEKITNVQAALIEIRKEKVSPEILSTRVLDYYPTLFNSYYPDKSVEYWLMVCDDVIEMLETEQEKYAFLDKTIVGLKKFYSEFENYVRNGTKVQSV